MDREVQIHVPLEHPCYAGHFPGNPVLPGVVLLELVVAALEFGAPRELGSVKFHRSVRPGESFTLRHQRSGAGVAFRCVRDELLLAEGTMTFAVEAGDRP
jgi:3-hydroxyacyl-[acyl-carrier-protein] dehydratase